MTQLPASRTTRDGALALVAAGNTIESVAHVLGVSTETLRAWIAQAGPAAPDDGTRAPEPARPWTSFPGTVDYPCGSTLSLVGAALVAMLVFVPAFGWRLLLMLHPGPLVVAMLAAIALAVAAAAIQAIRAARADRFEMRPDAIARYRLSGCTVLPYRDIVGLRAVPGKGFYYVEFLTRTGVLLTIHPTFAMLEDERLWAWLQAVPKQDGSVIRRRGDY